MDESGNDRPGAANPDPAPATRIDLRFASFTDFIGAYGGLVSESGMFLATESPPDVGSRVTLRFRLDDGFPLILADAQVDWLGRANASPTAPAGAALRFLHLDERSTTLIDHMVAQCKREGRQPFDLSLAVPLTTETATGEVTADGAARALGGPGGDPWATETAAAPDSPRSRATGRAEDVFEPDAERSTSSVDAPKGGLSTEALARALEDGAAPGQASDPRPAIDYAPTRADDEPRSTRSWLLQPATLVGMLAAAVLAVWVFSVLRVDNQASKQVVAPPTESTPAPPPATPTGPVAAAVVGSPSRPPGTAGTRTPTPPSTPTVVPRQPTPQTHPSPPAAAVARASRVVDISWRRTDSATEVVIETNGALVPARARHFVMDNPPRYVIRLLGIAHAYEPFELAVGTPQLTRIRVGFHQEESPPELHVVLDLAGSGQRAVRYDLGARSVTVTIGTSLEK